MIELVKHIVRAKTACTFLGVCFTTHQARGGEI